MGPLCAFHLIFLNSQSRPKKLSLFGNAARTRTDPPGVSPAADRPDSVKRARLLSALIVRLSPAPGGTRASGAGVRSAPVCLAPGGPPVSVTQWTGARSREGKGRSKQTGSHAPPGLLRPFGGDRSFPMSRQLISCSFLRGIFFCFFFFFSCTEDEIHPKVLRFINCCPSHCRRCQGRSELSLLRRTRAG